MNTIILDRFNDIYLLKYNGELYCIDKLNISVGVTLKACNTEKQAKKEFKKIKKHYKQS